MNLNHFVKYCQAMDVHRCFVGGLTSEGDDEGRQLSVSGEGVEEVEVPDAVLLGLSMVEGLSTSWMLDGIPGTTNTATFSQTLQVTMSLDPFVKYCQAMDVFRCLVGSLTFVGDDKIVQVAIFLDCFVK
ncbi:UNVERIFIED_CONTAM: hypothetical protein K2H54_061088 [Gekko kuhli]